MEDEDILKLIKTRPQEGVKAMFDVYWDKLYHYSCTILESDDAAKDVVQILFIKLWEENYKLSHVRNLKQYLYQAIKNNCLIYLQNNRFTELHNEVLDEIEFIDSMEEESAHNELEKELKNRLDALPERRRQILILSRYHGFSNDKIAEKLGLSVRTVETHISNALKSLREYPGIIESVCISIMWEFILYASL